VYRAAAGPSGSGADQNTPAFWINHRVRTNGDEFLDEYISAVFACECSLVFSALSLQSIGESEGMRS
jgi:hypothetical protein